MKNLIRWASVPALLLIALAGCEPATEPSLNDRAEPALSHALADYQRIEGWNPTELESLELSRLIDATGGAIHLGGHKIEVPAGAVTGPTLFTVSLLRSGFVEVDLSAVVTDLLGETVDVGSQGFGDKTVALTLSYAAASNVGDPSNLLILRMLDDGSVEPLDVVVDEQGKTVTAQLDHFSRYCMASS
jgi:hypothetical protein